MYIEKISTKFDEVIGSLESQRQHIEKYIDEKEGKLEELVAKVLGLRWRLSDTKLRRSNMAQQKRAVQGNRAKKLEIVLNVHRKLMSED